MKNKSYAVETEDEVQIFTETYNAAWDFLITQNQHLMCDQTQQQQQNTLPAK